MKGIHLHTISKPQGICKICGGNKADSRIDVQVNKFRGDDDVYKVHDKCLKKIGWAAFIDLIRQTGGIE